MRGAMRDVGVDEECIALLGQPRTTQSFFALAMLWYPRMLHHVRRSARGIQCDPCEVVHIALLRAEPAWPRFHGRSGAGAWIWMRYYLDGSLLSFRRRRVMPRGDLLDATGPQEEIIDAVDAGQRLAELVDLLSPHQRWALWNVLLGNSVGCKAEARRVTPRAMRETVASVRTHLGRVIGS